MIREQMSKNNKKEVLYNYSFPYCDFSISFFVEGIYWGL